MPRETRHSRLRPETNAETATKPWRPRPTSRPICRPPDRKRDRHSGLQTESKQFVLRPRQRQTPNSRDQYWDWDRILDTKTGISVLRLAETKVSASRILASRPCRNVFPQDRDWDRDQTLDTNTEVLDLRPVWSQNFHVSDSPNAVTIAVLRKDPDRAISSTNWLLQTLAYVDTIYLAARSAE